MTARLLLPPAILGILGSGQLGRMFALAAREMGYRIFTFSPESNTPTGQVADREFVADYGDLAAVKKFAQQVNLITFEFENVPFATAQAAAESAPVRPDGEILHTTQHRLREKNFLRKNGFPVTDFVAIKSSADIQNAAGQIPGASILKTAGWGYDGKGQIGISSSAGLSTAWEQLNHVEAILEARVDFEKEISVVAARSGSGEFTHWGVIENTHHHHILDTSIWPAAVSSDVATDAIAIARGILEQLKVVGVLTVEFFLTKAGKLIVNELAPRPHNSGHLTIEASITSQFEQQVRAVANLPLGSTAMLKPAALGNLLGDLWFATGDHGNTNSVAISPAWDVAMKQFPSVKLHLYGKLDARRGRKMGHLTAIADTADEAHRQVLAARQALRQTGSHPLPPQG